MKMIQAFHDYVENYKKTNENILEDDHTEYAPIEKSKLWEYKPAIEKYDIPVICGDYTPNGKGEMTAQTVSSDTILYAYARLSNWPFNSPEFQQIKESNVTFMDGGYEFVETLAGGAGDPQQPYSESKWV